MKVKLNKLKKLIVDNYKLAIPIILILVVFLSFIIYYFISRTFAFSKKEVDSYYQYFSGERIEYEVEVVKNRREVITSMNPVDRYVEYDSTPLYQVDKNVVIFPQEMSVILPLMNCSEYFLPVNSYVKLENKRYSLITKDFNDYLGHYFFYDGEDLYFFIENVDLVVNDKKIELTPFSYVIADNKEISYYDKKSGTFETISANDYDTYVSSEYYKVYVSGDYMNYYDERVVLTSDIEVLSDISEMRRITND